MPWVKWKDGALVENTLHQSEGVGDDWREVIDEVVDTIDKTIVIVEEDGQLYRRTYAQKRGQEYPHVKNQLDMMYKDQVNGTTTWEDLIASIKAKYPKE